MRSLAIRGLAAAAVLLALAAPARADKLTVASWNVTLASAKGKGASAPPYDRLKPIAGKLDADLIAVQGVDRATIERLFGTDKFAIESSGAAPLRTALLISKKLTYVRRTDYQASDPETGETGAGTWIDLTVGKTRLRVMSAATGITCGRAVITGDGKLRDRCDRLDLAVRNAEGWLRGRPGGLSAPYVVLGTVAAMPPAAPATADSTSSSKSDAKSPAGGASTQGGGAKASAKGTAAQSGVPGGAKAASGAAGSGGAKASKPAQLPNYILRAEAKKREEAAREHVQPGCASGGPGATLEYIAAGAAAQGWAQPETFQQLLFPGDKAVSASPGFDTGGTLADQCPILLTFDIR